MAAGVGRFGPSVRPPVVDVWGMQVSSSTSASASGAASSSGGNDIAALQRKLRSCSRRSKKWPPNIDAKAKQQKSKLLQTQIMMVQNQIEALMRARQQAQIDKQREQQQAAENPSQSPSKGGKAPGLGGVVDVYV